MKSLFSPFKALSFLGREPVSLPIEARPASHNYRGFHLNDWELCIGCGTCAMICDNRAIKMVQIQDLTADPIKGIKPQKPAIDYGRCCWCALCVDICPTGAISLSREYVHFDINLDSFFILPNERGIHQLDFPKGWAKSTDADLLNLDRQPMTELAAEERLSNFNEIVNGFDDEAALLEASRCIQCGMCHDACPTHMNAPEYIRAIWEGDLTEAVRQIYRTNPLASVCGRVCTHRCETACSVGRRGEPISIRWLKRYAMDKLSQEAIEKIASEGRITKPSNKQVAIVGSGPAGLTIAYDLARQGHAVTIYEANPYPGGMMRYGIPEYRLPYDKLDQDIAIIQSMGVEIICNSSIGDDQQITMQKLEKEYDAVVMAIGLHQGRSTRIPGADHPDVQLAVDLLRKITLGEKIEVPEQIAVIGGGNVAFDIARSLARLQRQQYGKVDVVISALEPANAMLADASEVREADEEGITLYNSRGPKRCVIEEGVLKGLETVKCLSIFDEQGRFHPMYDESDLIFHPAQLVVEAIGQAPKLNFLGEALTERLQWNRFGRPVIDDNGRTSQTWLWAAGDMVQGPDVIHAIAAGHRVADNIHTFLTNSVSATV